MNVFKISNTKSDKNFNIVFIHGLASSSRVFNEIIESEDLVDYNKILIDLPGHGQSLHFSDDFKYSIQNYKNEILESIKEVPNILLVGNSIGGNLAIELSAHLSSLKGLVVFGTAFYKQPINPCEIFKRNEALLYYIMEEVSEEVIDSVLNESVVNEEKIPIIKEDFFRCDPKVRSRFGKELLSNKGFLDQVKLLKRLRVPKYIIHGKQDTTVNRENLIKICDSIKDNIEFIELNNCGHFVSIDQPILLSNKLKKIADSVFNPVI